MTRRTAIVLQARMGSSRLPGKALEMLGGRALLERCIARLQSRPGFPVVLATTTKSEDDCLVALAERVGIDVVRGADEDVLGRFVEVVNRLGLETVVRATGDNPAVDADAPHRVVALLERTGADHVVERGLPYGAAVEAVTADALVAAAAATDDPYDREHVTPFIRRNRRFVALAAIAPGEVHEPDLRLTVDTPDDLEWLRRVVNAVGEEAFDRAPLATIIAFARRLKAAGSATPSRRSMR